MNSQKPNHAPPSAAATGSASGLPQAADLLDGRTPPIGILDQPGHLDGRSPLAGVPELDRHFLGDRVCRSSPARSASAFLAVSASPMLPANTAALAKPSERMTGSRHDRAD